ncbi:MAG: methyltransferase domain-containing protein [Ginsengibacter sp.]
MNNLKVINGFLVTPGVLTINAIEELYYGVALREGKIYSDKEIAELPVVIPSHLHYHEWMIRKRSCIKLLHYITRHNHIRNILEIGCGNGWLSAQLASVTRGNVTGIDINTVELGQAKKVFRKRSNLKFIEGDVRSGILADEKYDLIVFAASLQYFKSLGEILKTSIMYLTLQGEIHIIDNHFCRQEEIATVRQKSKEYFTGIGFPGMAQYYFHHSIHEIRHFRFSILHNPNSLVNKLSFRRNPFYWITIKNCFI